MTTTRRVLHLVLATALVAALAPAAAHAAGATRTWVSGVGDDANPCSRTAPCKTFAGAFSKTETGGEIDALDSGGFGTVTLSRSMTLDGAGAHASILNSGVTGVIVNAPGGNVTLRNLAINGAGFGGSGCDPNITGIHGVRILAAASVRLEHVTIQHQLTNGILVAPTAGAVDVLADDVTIANGCDAGVRVLPTAGATADVLLDNTRISSMQTGVTVGDGGRVGLLDSTFFANTVALAVSGSGALDSHGGNAYVGNGDIGAVPNDLAPPTTVTVPGPAPAPTVVTVTTPAAATTTTTPTTPTAARCKVPSVVRHTLASARRRLAKAGCAAGKVTRQRGTKAQRGRVVRQSRKAGTTVKAGTKVALVVGR